MKKLIKKNLLKKNWILIVGGALSGFVNGLLGAGGGMLAVPTLRKSGLDTKESHAGAIAVIMPLSVASGAMYLLGGKVAITDALPYLPGGIIGAVLGAIFLRKIKPAILRKIFGGFAIWAGIKMIFK